MEEFQNQRSPHPQRDGEIQYLFVGNKAGLDNVDKSKVTKIINEATSNSDFYKRQQHKRMQYDERIREMKDLINKSKPETMKLISLKIECEERISSLHSQLTFDRIWVHFDMDMFYVACEIKDRPELKELPVAVGGMSMISTANYVARKYGVRSAMPGFIAKKLCPQLILIPCNFEKYRKASQQFKNVLYQYDPLMEGMGLDEANLDLTDYLKSNDVKTDEQIYDLCHQIRQQVFEATEGLHCSCGIGPNQMIAKICSDINKPNGQFQLKGETNKVVEFMSSLPIRKIPGIGNVAEQLLTGIGIERCGQILERVLDVKICFSESSFEHLVASALGIGRNWHKEEEEKKSISVSRTFPQISTISEIHNKIHELSKMLAVDAHEEGKVGRHLSVTFKTYKFQVRSKNRLLDKFISDADSIEKYARQLVNELLPTEPLRLVGIRLSHLSDEDTNHSRGLEKYFSAQPKVDKTESLCSEEEQEEEDEESESISFEFADQTKLISSVDTTLNHNGSEGDVVFVEERHDSILNKELSQNLRCLEALTEKQNNPAVQIKGLESPQNGVILSKKRVPVFVGEEVDQEEQLKLKKKFIPRYFECPICYEQIDSLGNASFVNNHITNCMNVQQEQTVIRERDRLEGASILGSRPNSKGQRKSDQTTSCKKSKSSSNKKNAQVGTNTLDSFILRSHNP